MRKWGVILAAAGVCLLAAGTAGAAVVPGKTVEERAVNGAKAYLKKIGAEKLELNMMLTSLVAKAQP